MRFTAWDLAEIRGKLHLDWQKNYKLAKIKTFPESSRLLCREENYALWISLFFVDRFSHGNKNISVDNIVLLQIFSLRSVWGQFKQNFYQYLRQWSYKYYVSLYFYVFKYDRGCHQNRLIHWLIYVLCSQAALPFLWGQSQTEGIHTDRSQISIRM